MAINTNALQVKIKKAIKRLPVEIDVYRHKKNSFNEPDGERFITRLIGHYYNRQNGSITLILAENGITKADQPERFMTIIDDESLLVHEGDFFTLNGIKYKITDLGNTLDAYFDFSLERV